MPSAAPSRGTRRGWSGLRGSSGVRVRVVTGCTGIRAQRGEVPAGAVCQQKDTKAAVAPYAALNPRRDSADNRCTDSSREEIR